MIKKIEDKEEKARICIEILEALPEWFEIPESREAYAKESRGFPFWADVENGIARGFIAMKETSRYTVEICVMGVRKEYHRMGIGGKLFEAFYQYAKEKGYEFIQVKTVRKGLYPDYDLTNAFYQRIGFRELECMEGLWDEANPCQVYVMAISNNRNSITKNIQSESTIRQMALVAFPHKQMDSCDRLTEGRCNAAYLVKFSDGSKSVLKIAPGENRGLMANEVNMMDAEVKAMRIVRKSNLVKVAEVQYYDTSRTICSGNYFFMEALEGQSFHSVMENLSEEEKQRLNYETGQVERKLTTIFGEKFGLLGDEEHQYRYLYDFVYRMISNVLSDARRKGVIIGVESEEILSLLERDREFFDMVTQPTLVHWDMWEGNIFVKDGQISGIIDWERAMWGEALLDDRFRRHTRNREFMKGYGQEAFLKEEMQRIYWYDVLLYLTMMTEGAYREYSDDGQYQWAKPLFEASWRELQAAVF